MNWKQLQGQSVGGEFQLVELLGGHPNTATFLATSPGDVKFAVKLATARPNVGDVLARWKLAESLSHPHLLRVVRCGQCEINRTEFAFVAMEYAEENLAQVLPERALSPEEVRDMLPSVLDALDYLHANGLAHGSLKPGDIMAAADQLKLSPDNVLRFGEPVREKSIYRAPEAAAGVSAASDLWSLGVTLTEVLTQRRPAWESGSTLAQLPDTLPEKFRVIVQRCLIPDPALRGTTADIRERLKTSTVAAPPAPLAAQPRAGKPKPRWIVIPALAAVAIGATITLSHKSESPAPSPAPAAPASSSTTPPVPVQSTPPAVLTEATDARPIPQKEKTQPEEPQKMEILVSGGASTRAPEPAPARTQPAAQRSKSAGTDAVVRQVLPEIPSKALRTINGKFRVAVRVRVNPDGNVIGTKFISQGPSRYFADLTLEAAKDWKFNSSDVAERAWDLNFEFRRSGASVSSIQQD